MHFLNEIKKIYKVVIIINFLLIGFIVYQIFFSRYYWEGSEEKKFKVVAGSNSDEIISALKEADIISNSFLFKLAVKLTGNDDEIISNIYLLKNGMNNLKLISILTDKNALQPVRITIPPGYNLKQIARISGKKLSVSPDKILKEASNDSLINILGLSGQIKDLEGFLYPDTYDMSPLTNEKELVEMMFDEFRKKILEDSDIESKISERNTTLLETMTLASIIEGETRLEEERPIVAGVYLNRIKKGMRLEADPTIQYILPDGPKPRLLYEDLKIQSPYNTYLNKGLPPGPINNPGRSAVLAALNPAEHNYIFFVATGNGGHKFTENYAQHQQAIREYKANLRQKKLNQKKDSIE